MKNALVIGTLGLVASFAMLAFGFVAGNADADKPVPPLVASRDPGGLDKAGIERIVRDYLVANPDVLVEAQAALETRHAEQQQAALRQTLRDEAGQIYDAKYDGLIGNPDAKVTVVEFFDYNCTYCRHALGDMEKLVEDNPDLRFVMKEFPILGPDSQKAHVVSMAFRSLAPEKYTEFHTRLLGSSGRATEAAAIRVATSLGIDEAALRQAMKDPAIAAGFDETYDLANKLSINGTPAYIIGQDVISGALGHEALAQKVSAARDACTTASC